MGDGSFGPLFWKPGHQLIRTADGGYFCVISSESRDGDVTCNHSAFDYDIWVAKLSPSFEIQWSRCIGGSSTEHPNCVSATSDGGYIIAGTAASRDGDISDTGSYTEWFKSKSDAWAVKLDSNGMIEWDRRMGGTEVDYLTSIVQTSDGGYIGAGYTWSNNEVWRGQSWISHGDADAFVVRLDAKGKIKWIKLYGGSNSEGAYSILQTSDDGFMFAGWAQSRDGDVMGVHGDSTLDPLYSYNEDVWVVKLDTGGTILWQRCYGGFGREEAHCLIASRDSGYVIAAIADSADGDVTKHYWSKNPDREFDIWILKIDPLGNLLWEHTFGGTSEDLIASIIQTNGGGYAFCGSTGSLDGDVRGVHSMGPDVWIGGLSAKGDLLWQKTLGGTHIDYGNSIVQTDDDGFALSGTTFSTDGDVSGKHYASDTRFGDSSDAWVVKLSPVSSSVAAGSSGSNFAHPYPNPSASEMRLEVFHSSPVREVHYFNLMGAEFFPDHRIENTTLVTDMQKLPSGMYVVRITYSDPATSEDIRKFLHTN